MKAIFYNKKGAPEKWVRKEVEQPQPKDNEVLVKVDVVSPNAADYRMIQLGMVSRKKILGSGISGTVVSVGKDVQEFKTGDSVLADLADSGFGGLAEFAIAPAKALVLKPQKLSHATAASLPVAATTALQALKDKGNIQAGQKVLIIGSSGGVGTFAVQLASYFGAEVTAVCSTRNLEQSKALGADFVIDYTKEDFLKGDKRYDLILAINGNYSLSGCKRILAQNGIYVMVGGTFRQIFKALLLGRFMSFGSKKMLSLSAKGKADDLAFVVDLVAKGKIKPLIEKSYPFDQTGEAMTYILAGHAKGKIVIQLANATMSI